MSVWKRWFLLLVDQNITICTFMFQNVLFKIAQFTNDIVGAVNHVLFNMLIFITVEKSSHSKKKKKKKKKEKEKNSPFIYTYSFIHSFILTLTRKTVHKKKRGRKHGKYSKLIQLKPAPLLLIIISVHFSILILFYSWISSTLCKGFLIEKMLVLLQETDLCAKQYHYL